ncbi:glycosyltransferase [Microbacterium sp. 1.5R]|uniref:glycosyltransferase n=1 Tax=Microbacterium sp. 1.5R TaxID=1916917 RepID=UPI00119FA49C|nr:glycosyltransferase [Microbacterium sp. 1.5R]
MGARLRIVLDQLVHVVDADQAWAALDLTAGLVATAPTGCDVEAIVPAGGEATVPGVAETRRLSLARRELAGSWQLGLVPGVGGGLIHSASLMAPLVRHDRVHQNDQTTVTVWDLRAWEAPDTLPRSVVGWQRAMLRRAAKHADAVVVPTHSIGARLSELVKLGDRIRVIPGAAPHAFGVPSDAGERRRDLSVREGYVALTGSPASLTEGFRAAIAAGAEAVVLDAPEGSEPAVVEIGAAAGLAESRIHVRGPLERDDRAALLAGAAVLVATENVSAWPWRVLEAMTLGVPVVAVSSDSHSDVIVDGGVLATVGDLADAAADAAGGGARRLSVLAADRARAFSWQGAGERVWGLHADL